MPRAMTMKWCEPIRKCPKAIPRHLQNHVVWARILNCSVKSYVIGPSTICYFNKIPFMHLLIRDKNRIYQWLWTSGIPCSPTLCVRPTSKRWLLKTIQVTMKEHDAIRCHARIHIGFTSTLAFAYILRGSLKCSVKQANFDHRLRLFHQWECLKCIGHGLSVSCVK